jgi:hypothetical protein
MARTGAVAFSGSWMVLQSNPVRTFAQLMSVCSTCLIWQSPSLGVSTYCLIVQAIADSAKPRSKSLSTFNLMTLFGAHLANDKIRQVPRLLCDVQCKLNTIKEIMSFRCYSEKEQFLCFWSTFMSLGCGQQFLASACRAMALQIQSHLFSPVPISCRSHALKWIFTSTKSSTYVLHSMSERF